MNSLQARRCLLPPVGRSRPGPQAEACRQDIHTLPDPGPGRDAHGKKTPGQHIEHRQPRSFGGRGGHFRDRTHFIDLLVGFRVPPIGFVIEPARFFGSWRVRSARSRICRRSPTRRLRPGIVIPRLLHLAPVAVLGIRGSCRPAGPSPRRPEYSRIITRPPRILWRALRKS